MTLADVKPDTLVVIKKLLSGRHLQTRLISMGILPKSKVRVISSSYRSPVTIKIKDSIINIGHGMASKIVVELI